MTGAAPRTWAPSDPIACISVPCSNCGAEDATVLWTGVEHEYPHTTDAAFPVVRCTTCGLARLSPRPDVSELDRIYPPDYYAYNLVNDAPDEDHGPVKRFVHWCKKTLYLRRLDASLRGAPAAGTIRLLDVGCGDGRLLDWYKRSAHGGRIETHGIEMNHDAALLARRAGHRVVVGRFEQDTQLEAGSFDLVLASHVIEHVADPVAFAARAAELLRPGGLFVVGTPNIDSREVSLLREHWGGNHFPRHWTFYDARTIRELAAKSGLAVERVVYQPNPIFWVWSCHSWLAARSRKLADKLFPPVRIFQPGPLSLVLLSGFTILDLAWRLVTRRTASMSVELRKPTDPR